MNSQTREYLTIGLLIFLIILVGGLVTNQNCMHSSMLEGMENREPSDSIVQEEALEGLENEGDVEVIASENEMVVPMADESNVVEGFQGLSDDTLAPIDSGNGHASPDDEGIEGFKSNSKAWGPFN
jgi:hypothetical protein